MMNPISFIGTKVSLSHDLFGVMGLDLGQWVEEDESCREKGGIGEMGTGKMEFECKGFWDLNAGDDGYGEDGICCLSRTKDNTGYFLSFNSVTQNSIFVLLL